MTPTSEEPSEVTDQITVRGIEATGHHGVFDFERRDGQRFLVDLVLGVDTRPPARSDDLHDTVDYGSLAASVVDAVESDPVSLIETLAQRIADRCLADSRVHWTEVTVHKPEAPVQATFADVAVTIRRERADAGQEPAAAGQPDRDPDQDRSRP